MTAIRLTLRSLCLAALALAAGCKPKIGDACTTALNCSALGDRLCDATQPGGYCTQYGCQPDGCPTEAACIVFRSELDPECGTATDGKYGRFAQAFCMRTCTDSSDCRDGYECALPTDHAASLLDQQRDNPNALKVCVAVTTPIVHPPEAPGVCSPGKAPPLEPTTASASGSGTSTTTTVTGSAASGGQGGAGQGGAGLGGSSQGGAGGI